MNIEKVAALIAEVAAREIQPRFRNLLAHEMREKSPGDVVTVADEQAELALTPLLMDQVPGSIVIGEEAAAKDPNILKKMISGQLYWVVDPVDGTANFAEGKSDFCSMVALVRGDELLASWIHLPVTGETAMAEHGGGASFAGRKLPKLARTTETPAGVVGVGKLSKPELHPRAEALRRQIRQVKSLRCAGLDYLRLAQGAMDFTLFGRAWPWDHAPGALLVREVGGVVGDPDGAGYRPSIATAAPGVLAARNEEIWRQLLKHLEPAR
ncbi:MAG TPA: inositol monophosphatase [Dongiaceae bacterium]|nr:inositol monophosphatase [Dongiaceae bacterium]